MSQSAASSGQQCCAQANLAARRLSAVINEVRQVFLRHPQSTRGRIHDRVESAAERQCYSDGAIGGWNLNILPVA